MCSGSLLCLLALLGNRSPLLGLLALLLLRWGIGARARGSGRRRRGHGLLGLVVLVIGDVEVSRRVGSDAVGGVHLPSQPTAGSDLTARGGGAHAVRRSAVHTLAPGSIPGAR